MGKCAIIRFAACAAVAGLAVGCCSVVKPGYDTLIAHRGESVDAPENTLPAYRTAVASRVPEILVRRGFKKFVREELDGLFGTAARRIVAHPYGDGDACAQTPSGRGAEGRLVLAVGPEGGWTDEEVALLEAKGFERQSLGPRILRTDTATVALLARLMPDR